MSQSVIAPLSARDRYPLLDALRGLALLGILLVNMEGYSTALDGGWSEFSGTTNDVSQWFVTSFAALKFYTLFSLLFGYGLAVQLARVRGDLDALLPRYKRRLLGLFVLGLAHAVLFYWGDILMLYALVGLTLIPLSRLSDRDVLVRALWAFGIGAVLYLLLGAALLVSGSGDADLAAIESARTAYADGSFGDIIGQRLEDAFIGQIGVLVLQGPTVFAAFALGLVLGRRGILARSEEHRALFRRTLVIGLPIGLGGGMLAGALGPTGTGGTAGLGVILLFLSAPALTLSYVAAFGLIPHAVIAAPVFWILRAPGRMSLSVYLLESIAAAIVFTSLGFGLFQAVDAGEGLVLSLGIWLGLAIVATAWMSVFRLGPFEWLLRSLTYRRFLPLLGRSGRT